MSEKDAELNKLILENNRLRAENKRLTENQMQHCRGCYWVERHPCGAFMQCGWHGRPIDVDADGCSWRKEK